MSLACFILQGRKAEDVEGVQSGQIENDDFYEQNCLWPSMVG